MRTDAPVAKLLGDLTDDVRLADAGWTHEKRRELLGEETTEKRGELGRSDGKVGHRRLLRAVPDL